jgi:hypothetical protein
MRMQLFFTTCSFDYLNRLKWPRKYHRRTNTSTVEKHPPPSFFAPYPAATPRKSLLTSGLVLVEVVIAVRFAPVSSNYNGRAHGLTHQCDLAREFNRAGVVRGARNRGNVTQHMAHVLHSQANSSLYGA